jgi:hypothetical protein
MSSFLLIILAIASRVVPHTWLNFTAVGGSLLYFGARRPLREAALPLAMFALTDYYLTVEVYNYAFHVQDYAVTWLWYAAAIILGRILLHDRVTPLRVGSAAVMSATSFFAVSNYAIWAGSTGMYPHNLLGLAACYTAALPFYRNDLLSTSLFLALAFGLPALARRMAEHETRDPI